MEGGKREERRKERKERKRRRQQEDEREEGLEARESEEENQTTDARETIRYDTTSTSTSISTLPPSARVHLRRHSQHAQHIHPPDQTTKQPN